KDRVLGSGGYISHPTTDVDMNLNMRNAVQIARSAQEIDVTQSRCIGDIAEGERARSVVDRAITKWSIELVRGIAKNGWNVPIEGRTPVQITQRPTAITGHFADNPLKPVEVHAVPGPEEQVWSVVLTSIPGQKSIRPRGSMDRRLVIPTQRVCIRER